MTGAVERRLALAAPPRDAVPLAAWIPRTKFLAPAVGSDVVLDPEVVERLVRQARTARLTLVVAQGGSGKTTLVAAAAPRFGSPVAWLRLDPADDAPRSLVELIVAAVDHALPGAAATALDLVTSGHPLPPRQVVGVLINDLVADGRDVTLVLDDVHHVTDPDAVEVLDDLLRHAPSAVHVVATGRRAPALRLARLRVAGQLAEVVPDELRFDAPRAEALLVGHLGLRLDPGRITDLLQATNGWVTALVLRATAGDGHAAPGAGGTPEALDEYLADEVLASEAPAVRDFLLLTSVLDVLDVEACAVVSGRDDADLLLADVRRRLRLLVDDLGGRWRYHDLLRDHLRAALRRDLPRWRLAHERAADVAPPGPERVEHLLAAGAQRRAAEEIAALGRLGPTRRALAERIAGWAERLDPEVRAAHPWVDLAVAASLATRGRIDAAAPLLASVVERAPEDDFELRWLALRFQLLATREYARLGPLLHEMERDGRYVGLPVASRVEQAIGAAWAALWSGDPDGARRRVEEATGLARRSADPGAAEALAVHYASALTAWPGGPEALGEHGRWALEVLGADSAAVRVGARLQLASAELLTGTGPGEVVLTPGEAELAAAVPYWALVLRWLRAVRARLDGDAPGVVAALPDDVAATGGELLVALAPLVASALRELRRSGEIVELRRLLQLVDAPDPQLQARALGLVDAHAAWAAGDLERAAAVLRDVDERSRRVEVVVLPEAAAELAVLLAEQGRLDRAVRALEPVLDRIGPMRAWSRIAQSGRALVPVLQAVAGPRRAAAASTLALLSGAAAPAPLAVPGSPEVLTSREVEVLRELATGASNQEIGGRLHLSENTVKTHVKRVLSKLEAPSRTAAVARARQLGLL